MMKQLFLLASALLALSQGSLFAPKVLEGSDHHKERVWLWLHTKCFKNEAAVLEFKDFLLSKYECITYDRRRPRVYQMPTAAGHKVWSLWLERKDARFGDFSCLAADKNASLPQGIFPECVSNAVYEPLESVDQFATCNDQGTDSKLWSIDLLDGVENGLYRYSDLGTDSGKVEAIVLDTDVQANHVEFTGLTVTSLFNGTLNPRAVQDHGTHVSGTILGQMVGGAKGTALNYYPVCQLGGSCAWNDIEAGYEAAIELMEKNKGKVTYVINYSVGGARTTTNEIAYNDFGRRIQNAGGFWVTSAGNSAADACRFAPAFSSYAITVGAFSSDKTPTTRFTNYGSCVDIWGAGESVYSSLPNNGYGIFSGTSMASPNIASIVVNTLKKYPSLSLVEVKSRLTRISQPLLGVPASWEQYPEPRWAYISCGDTR